MTASLCMLISLESERRVRSSFQSALRYVKPDEILIGLSPMIPHMEKHLRYWLDEAASLTGLKPDLTVVPGARDRSEVAIARARLYGMASCDWIVVLDDDDGALAPYPLDTLGTDVGSVHSDVIAVRSMKTGAWDPGDVFFRPSARIEQPDEANRFMGSYYAYRRVAWLDVAKHVGNETGFEEWRTVWMMVKRGWRDYHVPRVLQWQTVGDFQKQGITWKNECLKMERRFGNASSDSRD